MATNHKKGAESPPPEDQPEAEESGQGGLEVLFPKPPDGGWGWVIVLASLLANIIVDGITYTFGIFLPKFEEAFQQPKRTVALAGSLQVGTYLCAGPIVSALTNRFGCKNVTMAGSVVATAGFVLSVFAPTANILILTYGIIGGFGFGMMYLPAIVIVGYYFEKKRALATGIAVCGSGIGMFIMAPLSEYLLHEFGYRGALLIIGGLVFNGAICGALMRPLPVMQPNTNNGDKAKPAAAAAAGGERTEAKEPLMKSTTPPQDNGNDVSSPSKPPEKKQELDPLRPAIVILDEGPSSSSKKSGTRDEFAFFSVPSVVYASSKDPKAQLTVGRRPRSNTLDQEDKIRLRHIAKEIVPEARKPAKTPIGLSYIGLSDAQINRVRATAHVNVSRRDMFMSAGSRLQIPDSSLWKSAQSMRSYTQEKAESVLCACLPESARDTLLQMLDFSIMTNKAYVVILIGNIFAMLGFYVPFVFMPEKAMRHGISESEAAFLLSIIGITNTVGRVLTGVLANLNKIDSLLINNIAMLVCGIVTFLTPFCTEYVLLCLMAGAFGLCVAAYISLSSILLCDMLGVEQLTNAFGFLTLARGVSSCAGSPLAGAIIDETNDVDLAFYVGGALIVAGALCHFLLFTPCLRQKKESTTTYVDDDDDDDA